MKMTDYTLCCDQCVREIADKSVPAAMLWLDLCCTSKETNRVKSRYISSLWVLEHMGFLVSTEDNQGVAVKLCGRVRLSGGDEYFCLRHGEHD